MRRLGALLFGALLFVAVTASCGLTGTKLLVSGAGTFPCPSYHGCVAWFVVRPIDWSRPAGWEPGKLDGQFPTTFDHQGMGGQGTVIVAGTPVGGPSVLQPGKYRFSLLHSEVSDIEPFVLGTDEQPTSGIITTTFDCEATFSADRTVAILDVRARFGGDCALEFQPR